MMATIEVKALILTLLVMMIMIMIMKILATLI